MAGQAYIGTSGWIYKHWKDLFYRDVKQKDWLPHYARHFPTVEVNNSFYRKPTADAVRAWPSRTPAHFKFAVKMWRGITHYRKLKDARDLLDKFMPVINVLPPPHRGPLLVQLPGNLHANPERLDSFLTELARTMDAAGWDVVVEFRSPDWLTAEVYGILDRHGVAACLADMPKCMITRPNSAPFLYVRRHGTWGPYNGAYPPEHVEADARQVREWTSQGRDVWVYYNNDIGGHAVNDAMRLKERLGQVAFRTEADEASDAGIRMGPPR